jgi:GTPase
VAIVGYTNAGKSTLLNTLTGSRVDAEDKLFATLDPTVRRIRFPREREIVLLDTVGFIRDLPPALMQAFSATLEEVSRADLLLHVVDATDPDLEQQMETVEKILSDLDASTVPRFLVFNKCDALAPHERETMERQRRTNRLEITRSFFVSALQRPTTRELVGSIEQFFWASGRIEDDPAWQYEVVDEPEGAADLPEVTDLDSERRRRGHTA